VVHTYVTQVMIFRLTPVRRAAGAATVRVRGPRAGAALPHDPGKRRE